MNRDELKYYDFSEDVVPPDAVHEHIRAHDTRMSKAQDQMARVKAAYTTRWWEWIRGRETEESRQRDESHSRVEVNRIKPAMSAYLSALYPRELQATVSHDPGSQTGDATKAEMVLNRWINTGKVRERVLHASRQGLLYPCAGSKVGHDPGTSSAVDRVWMRVFPPWELVLDHDVHDWDDQRFVGHVFFRPRHEVEEEYGLARLGGTHREDFLSSRAQGSKSTAKNTNPVNAEDSPSDSDAFVRVLELCNLIDVFEEDGIRYQGRLEVYVLDQSTGYDKPVWMGALPYSKPDGSPLPHIAPLLFEHEPEFPLRGVAYADQMMPQQEELNNYRSYMAMATRKDARQALARKGALNADEVGKLAEGREGQVAWVPENYKGRLDDIFVWLKQQPISSGIMQYQQLVEHDLTSAEVASPAARQEVTKATKMEIQVVEKYTESEFGRHAERRDAWLADVAFLVCRALIAAMQDPQADSAGAFEDEDPALAPVGGEEGSLLDEPSEEEVEDAEDEREEEVEKLDEEVEKLDEDVDDEDDEDDEDVDDIEVLVSAAEGDAQAEVFGEAAEAREARPYVEAEVLPEQVILLQNSKGDLVEITPADLDADFVIKFDESGTSPARDAEVRQNLVALQGPLMEAWSIVNDEKTPPAMKLLAREWFAAVSEQYRLPKSLHPDWLERRVAEDSEEMGDEEQDIVEAGDNVIPMQQPQQPEVGPDEALQQALQLPPAEALELLGGTFGQRYPEVAEFVERAKGLPPEGQAEAVAMLVQELGGQPPAAGV